MSTVHHTRRARQRLAATLVLAAYALNAAAAESLTRYVDPFIGTDGTGHVLPGASMPCISGRYWALHRTGSDGMRPALRIS